jgi:hypothetical protein
MKIKNATDSLNDLILVQEMKYGNDLEQLKINLMLRTKV